MNKQHNYNENTLSIFTLMSRKEDDKRQYIIAINNDEKIGDEMKVKRKAEMKYEDSTMFTF